MPSKKPNILVIMTDHQALETLACYGYQRHSPATNRLAKEGVCFTNAFTTTPMCGPARCAIETGLMPNYLGIPNNTWGAQAKLVPPESNIPCTPHYLIPAGYTCGYVGKFHLSGTPIDYGYEQFIDYAHQGHAGGELIQSQPFCQWLIKKGVTADGIMRVDQCERGVRYYNGRTGEWCAMSGRLLDYSAQHTGVAFLCDQAIQMINEYQTQDAPWLLQLHTQQNPHWPYIVPEPYASMYDPREIPEKANFRDLVDHHPLQHKRIRDAWLSQDNTWEHWAESISKYYGICSLIEDQMVRVLDHLDHLGIAKDTMVIWTADHGAANGAHGIFDKDHRIIDEVFRVPMIIRYPNGNFRQGTKCDQLVQNLDLLPTMIEIAKKKIPTHLHGRSMVPALRGKEREAQSDHVFLSTGGSPFGMMVVRSIRTHRYKYIYNAYDLDEFYDLQNDPAELKNCIDMPDMAEEIRRLKNLLIQEMKRTEDVFLYHALFDPLRPVEATRPKEWDEKMTWNIWAGEGVSDEERLTGRIHRMRPTE